METPWGAADKLLKAMQGIQERLDRVIGELEKVNKGLDEANRLLKKQSGSSRPPA